MREQHPVEFTLTSKKLRRLYKEVLAGIPQQKPLDLTVSGKDYSISQDTTTAFTCTSKPEYDGLLIIDDDQNCTWLPGTKLVETVAGYAEACTTYYPHQLAVAFTMGLVLSKLYETPGVPENWPNDTAA